MVHESSTSPEYDGRLAIPAIGPRGNVYSIRYRALKPDTPAKYKGMAGIETKLFNLRAIKNSYDIVCITEGEMDTIILEQCGFPSVAVCGATNWKSQAHRHRIFAGYNKVFIFGDGDQAGRDFSVMVNASLTNGVIVRLPQGQDVNDLYLSGGEAAIRSMLE